MLDLGDAPLQPIWLASYPRSGNTFLRILLQNLFRLPSYSIYRVEGQDFHDPSADALEAAPFLPRNWRDRLSDSPDARPLLIKTHGQPEKIGKTVYIVRDGRATVDSYFHYHQKFSFEQPSLTELIAGACQFGSWSEHYRAWQPQRRPQTLFLRYEDLVNEPAACVPLLAGFVQAQPVDAKLPTFAELKARLPGFFRKGGSQDFLREWTPSQLALFNELHGEVMAELGYPLAPTGELGLGTALELARSASRSHQLYLEFLQKEGAGAAAREQLQQQVNRLSETVRQLSEQLAGKERVLGPLLENRWVRFGMAVHAVKRARNGNGNGHAAKLDR